MKIFKFPSANITALKTDAEIQEQQSHGEHGIWDGYTESATGLCWMVMSKHWIGTGNPKTPEVTYTCDLKYSRVYFTAGYSKVQREGREELAGPGMCPRHWPEERLERPFLGHPAVGIYSFNI